MNAAAVIVVAGTLVAAGTDLRSGTIPDALCAAMLGLVLVAAALAHALASTLLGATAGGASLLAIFALTGGRGIGLGDVKLAAAIGAGLGAPRGLEALAVAFVAGACVGIALLVTRRAHRRTALPFAPFLALGTVVCVVAGQP
jgi:prepilin signal peptidase PulO-like enzyme (type II secretory pathway)